MMENETVDGPAIVQVAVTLIGLALAALAVRGQAYIAAVGILQAAAIGVLAAYIWGLIRERTARHEDEQLEEADDG